MAVATLTAPTDQPETDTLGSSTQPVAKAKPLPLSPATATPSPATTAPPLTPSTATPTPAAPQNPTPPISQTDPMAFAPLPMSTPTVEQATTAAQSANDAAHLTTNPVSQTQTTDPYGRNITNPADPNASASNTFDAQAGMTLEQQYAYWQDQQKQVAAQTGTAYNAPSGDSIDAINADPNLAGAVATATATTNANQAKSNEAINNGYSDPAIRSQFFDPTGNPLPQGGANGLPVSDGTGSVPTSTPLIGAPGTSPASPPINGLPATPTDATPWEQAIPQFGAPTTTATPDPMTATPQFGANGLPATPSSTTSVTPAVSPAPTTLNGLPASASTGGNSGAGYNLAPTIPNTSLSNSTITPGPGVDRFKIAQDEYNAAKAASEPGYRADLTMADRMAAGAGTIGSGQLNTSLGNIANTRQQTLANQQSNFLNTALTGTIADQYQNIGIAQQQQGVQIGQQNTAFNQQMSVQQLMDSEQGQQWAMQMQAMGFNAQQIQQAFENQVQTQQLSDTENNQSFNQSMQKLLVGSAGDPSGIELIMMQVYGMDADAAAKAAANYYQTGQLPQPKPTTTTTTGSGATGSQGQPTE